MVKIRLHKLMSERGVASRRASETMIREGRVKVDGVIVTQMGRLVDSETETVTIDDHPLRAQASPRAFALNKPCGYLCTCNPSRESGKKILDLLPDDRRYFPVGRLDRDSSGLIVVTDDGALAHRLSHPRFGARKKYLVETAPPLTSSQIATLMSGVNLEDGIARALTASVTKSGVLEIVLGEGRKRQIRRMIEAVGSRVVALHRVQIGSLEIGELKAGEYRELTPQEIQTLLAKV